MFFLTRRLLTTIHRTALTLAVANGILAGFFAGLLADERTDAPIFLCCFLAACLWTLTSLAVALRTRQHPHGYRSFRGLTVDAVGDDRCLLNDGTAYLED
jgi:hypothetical protein